MASGCASSANYADAAPDVQLSPGIRAEARRGTVRIPKCPPGAAGHPCVKGYVRDVRRSELRKSRALVGAVSAVDAASKERARARRKAGE